MIFSARQFKFIFPRPTLVMGIVNVTPDSFSDGGNFLETGAAVTHGLKLVRQGAEIIDVGGESTRPNALPVSEEEELHRVIPVIEKLAAQIKIPISIDTMKPAVALAALAAGASIINDVAANRTDEAMWKIVSESHAGYVCMHTSGANAGLPANLHKPTEGASGDRDVIDKITDFFQERLQKLNACGIVSHQVVLDPGIGFGKTLEQNLLLLANLRHFTKLECPLLLGVSRKSFIGKLLGLEVNERLPVSLACATLAVESGVQIIRTHDVAETVQSVRLTEILLGRRQR